MRRTLAALALPALAALLTLPAPAAAAYKVLYAEQFYRLYHLHFSQYPDDTMENIVWLQSSLTADFANPLNALTRIENQEEWDFYRNLFRMHVNVLLTQLHMTLGSKFDKRDARFFNAPWAWANLESLEHAETAYQTAHAYWAEAVRWSQRAWRARRPGLHLQQIQYWEDENYRIQTGDLDYAEIIDENLARLFEVRRRFQEMDETTY